MNRHLADQFEQFLADQQADREAAEAEAHDDEPTAAEQGATALAELFDRLAQQATADQYDTDPGDVTDDALLAAIAADTERNHP